MTATFRDLAHQHGWAAAADIINTANADRYQQWIAADRDGHWTDPQYDPGFEQALAAQDTADAEDGAR